MKRVLVPLLFLIAHGLSLASLPVPYTGKISVRGVNYFGEAQFLFSLHDGQGTTYWQNGEGSGDTIQVPIRNGRYHVLLGGQGMTPLPPELFLEHEELYLRVEFKFEEGDELQHLAPDQVITATPRALVAEWAKMAQRVSPGAITRSMLSEEVLADLNKTAHGTGTDSASAPPSSSITRDMLSADLRADLNRTVTKQMLGQDVLSDLTKTITREMLPADVLNDLNRTITASNLAPNTITTAQLNEQVLKYLRPEVVQSPEAPGLVFHGQRGLHHVMSLVRTFPRMHWSEYAVLRMLRYLQD